jgi:hypothetical protein
LFTLSNLAVAAMVVMTLSLLVRGRLLPAPVSAPPLADLPSASAAQ